MAVVTYFPPVPDTDTLGTPEFSAPKGFGVLEQFIQSTVSVGASDSNASTYFIADIPSSMVVAEIHAEAD
ncbi:MAG: hypothetical protein KGL39_19060, partial [Patescibacteria group bacterium]|nr:hypothetical protein [Patescibacteria group bacterium]